MQIITGSTSNTVYTKASYFNDMTNIDPDTGLTNLIYNGNAETGTTIGFFPTGISRTGSYDGSYCFYDVGQNVYYSNIVVPVNTADTYQFSVYFKSMGSNQSVGATGLECFDLAGNVIYKESCAIGGNTTLANAVNNGDTTITLTDASAWPATGDIYYSKRVLFFPSNHPLYYTPWSYSRLGYGDYTVMYGTRTGNTLYLSTDGTNNNLTWSFGNMPAGTPVSYSTSGGTHAYYLNCGVPYPYTWTKSSVLITGEGATSGCGWNVFRNGTKYVSFFALHNYGQDNTAILYYDNITLVNLSRNQTNAYTKQMSNSKLGGLYTSHINELGGV